MTLYRLGDFGIRWHSHDRKAQCPPNPQYPNGKTIVAHGIEEKVCVTTLPYPAAECGLHMIHCNRCGQRVAITAAGRPDDPIVLELGCL